MAFSSDDEAEVTLIIDSVTNYQFVNREDEPIPFSSLPFLHPSHSDSKELYLSGKPKDRLEKVYQPVIAWKLELPRNPGPAALVLSKDGNWIKLLDPRKSYEQMIRTILITIHTLHFIKWNSNAVEKSLWDCLRRVFDKFERRPSEEDLRPHHSFMKKFAEQDETVSRSQLLKGLLERKRRKKSGEGNSGSVAEMKAPFIAADDEVAQETGDGVATGEDGDSEEENDLVDSVCCFCDNGGELLCCDGECLRSFHATKKAGEESKCKSLGMSTLQVQATQSFLCKNCEVKQHQCFACGRLGNSDKSKGAEVFQCSNATCGHFYHPKCVAKLVHPDDESKASECEKNVFEGKFTCPSHRCYVCKKLEDMNDFDLNFATCRRCPSSYHRKCLPRKIAFETEAEEHGWRTRAWGRLLPNNRILIYCLKHQIDEDLGTPTRNIKFPVASENREKLVSNAPVMNRKRSSDNTEEREREKASIKKRSNLSEEQRGAIRSSSPNPSPSPSPKEKQLGEFSQNKRYKKPPPKIKMIDNELKKGEGSGVVKSPRGQVARSDLTHTKIIKTAFPPITSEAENKVRDLFEKESKSLSMEDVLKKRAVPSSTHVNSMRQFDKATRGKIEGFVEAIQTSNQRISEGISVEDAKAVCEPAVLKQVAKWHKRLGVYLSPFLHGMRYTSFGRHFTKEDKLEEIVSKLQWYVQTDDTIVDFCCGSNDFSRLMKQKMDAMNKNCNFKNFDIIRPQNEFCFEKRDWMTVQTKELPNGASLIMGLNPPFGLNGTLANKFINQALTFKPKLVILIVPKETERLDAKRLAGSARYELIWEDNVTLAGKSFYLPGSVDENGNQIEQWNRDAPFLYLWSRSDWGARHRAIAEEHGHFSVISSFPSSSSLPNHEQSILAADIISHVVDDIDDHNNNNINNNNNNNNDDDDEVEFELVVNEVEENEGEEVDGDDDDDDDDDVIEERGKKREKDESEKVKSGRRSSQERERKSKDAKKEINEENESISEEREMKAREDARKKITEERERKESEDAETKINEERERKKINEERERKAREDAEMEKEERERKAREDAERKMKEERERKASEDAERKMKEERERKASEVARELIEARERREKEDARRKINEESERREKEIFKSMRNEEKERQNEAERRSISEREAAREKLREAARKKRLNEEREKQKEKDNADARKRLAEEREIKNQAERRRISEERVRERRRSPPPLSLARERERRSSPTGPRERERRRSSPTGPRERITNITRSSPSDPRERNSMPHRGSVAYSDMEISPPRNNNTSNRERNSPIINNQAQNQPIDMRHLDIAPSQDDLFDNIGPLFGNINNNNIEDIDDIARRYASNPAPSFNWNTNYNRFDNNRGLYPIENINRGFDDYDTFGRLYQDEPNILRQSSYQSHNANNTSSSSYLSGLGGGGAGDGTSMSTIDRYAPRLDETNFTSRPGPQAQTQFNNFGYRGFGGSSTNNYDLHGVVRRDLPPPPPQSDQLGFGPRHPYPFSRPPPGGSGGWIND